MNTNAATANDTQMTSETPSVGGVEIGVMAVHRMNSTMLIHFIQKRFLVQSIHIAPISTRVPRTKIGETLTPEQEK